MDLARATKAYPNVDLSQLNHAIPYVVGAKPEDLKDDWQKKYVDAILKATGETDINQFLAKVNGQPYGMGELRKDLRGIQNVVNGQWHKDNDARFASIKKEGRDRNEEISYKGHTFKLTTWEERDRLNINLTDECCGGADVLDLWDEDARGMIEDGFIDPRKMIQSAVEYADSVGLIQPLADEDVDQFGPMVEASSQRSREAAKKHEANLGQRYANRKLAEEVPTADNILTEVLTDMGQAPIVNVPGTDNNQPATTSEAQNIPAPMKSEEPEQAKEQTAPEQEAKPFETKAAKGRKSGSQKIADVMDLLEGTGHYAYSRHMAEAVAGDIADAKSEVTFNKSDMADNNQVDQKSPNELFGKEAALLDDEEEWCEACQQHRPCSCDNMESDRAKEGKKAGHEGERHDDVPVSQGETESGPKQPASDLSGAAPEAHDAPAPVDKKVAVGEMSEGMDPALIEGINEETAQMEDNDAASYRQRAEEAIENEDDVIYDVAANSGQMVGNVKHMDWFVEAVAQALMEQDELENIDPLANAPGYREHSNALDAQLEESADFWKD